MHRTTVHSSRYLQLLLIAGLALSTGRAQTTIISDNFNDGSLGTNSGGTGTGFTSLGQSTVTESGGFANFNTSPSGFVQTMVIQSNDAFNPFQSGLTTTATFTFGTVLLDSQQRQWLGYRIASATTNHFFPGTGAQGLYVSVVQNNASEDTAYTHQGNLVAVNGSGTATTIASWDWGNANGLSGLILSLAVTDTTYSLSFSGASGSSATFTTGAASGSLTGLGTISSNFEVGLHNQYWDSAAQGGITLDSITVISASAIPEPGTYAMVAGAATLGLAVWRRRKKSTQPAG